jgi:hypothetical protein
MNKNDSDRHHVPVATAAFEVKKCRHIFVSCCPKCVDDKYAPTPLFPNRKDRETDHAFMGAKKTMRLLRKYQPLRSANKDGTYTFGKH